MAIDRQQIIQEMAQVRVSSNNEGLIPAMGVYIQQLPADFWNSFSADMVKSASGARLKVVESLLYHAAHECGYHTGHGIITSAEWNRIVGPMIEKVPEDVLYGAYAVFSAWGWGHVDIVELIPNEKMVLKAIHYYEAIGAQEAGIKRPFAYMISGVSAGFMDLAYGGPYPNGLGSFTCEQTKGIEVGDAYGEFVVTRKSG